MFFYKYMLAGFSTVSVLLTSGKRIPMLKVNNEKKNHFTCRALLKNSFGL